MLSELLQHPDGYALCLSPGFFRFYALMGVIEALHDNECLQVKSLSGSSAGALVAGFLASGMAIAEMPERVFAIKRADIWDVGVGFGVLKGQLFQTILENQLPVSTFEQCTIPIGVTAYDVLGFRTACLTKGNLLPCIHLKSLHNSHIYNIERTQFVTPGSLATAIRASCTFPGLFQPVMVDGRPHIDGGVYDDGGLMALPSIPSSHLIVNVVCGRGRIASSVLPEQFKHARLLTLGDTSCQHILSVHPIDTSYQSCIHILSVCFRQPTNGITTHD